MVLKTGFYGPFSGFQTPDFFPEKNLKKISEKT